MTEVAHGAEAAAEGAHGGFPPFDASLFPSQIFWFAIAFGALYLVLAIVIIPRIGATLAARKAKIEGDIKAAQEETLLAEAAKKEADKAQADARSEARATLDTMRKKIDDENSKAQAVAMAEAEEKIQAAETILSGQKSSAIASISEEVSDIASSIFEQLVGKKPTAAVLKAATKGAN